MRAFLIAFVFLWPLVFMVGCCKAGEVSGICRVETSALNCAKAVIPSGLAEMNARQAKMKTRAKIWLSGMR